MTIFLSIIGLLIVVFGLTNLVHYLEYLDEQEDNGD